MSKPSLPAIARTVVESSPPLKRTTAVAAVLSVVGFTGFSPVKVTRSTISRDFLDYGRLWIGRSQSRVRLLLHRHLHLGRWQRCLGLELADEVPEGVAAVEKLGRCHAHLLA